MTTSNPNLPEHVEAPVRKLSLWRVMLALIISAGLIFSANSRLTEWKENKFSATKNPWFAAYVDVTSTPRYDFEQLGATSTPHVVLAFIVSSKEDPCTPTWGSAYTLDEAGKQLDLDRRIARLQQQGGKVAISFGGLLNDELALGCTNHDLLLQAYTAVIDRYSIDTIDLDLENTGLTDVAALKRRAKVMAEIQQRRRASGKPFAVWLTLPVAPQGLTPDGTRAVVEMLASGTDLAGVNLMTMDYGGSKLSGQSMFEASKAALIQGHRQLGILYTQAGINLNPKTLWGKIGATPMIGQNDVPDEVFSLEDAEALNQFALEQGAGRMSMWSANRDVPCGENYVDLKKVSDSCSGVKFAKLAFGQTLSAGFTGDLTQNAMIITTADPKTTTQPKDDPAKSPYPIWQETGIYLEGAKVVWHQNVYVAKWWTKSDVPDNPVLQSWETPWQLIGPVLPGEEPIEQPTLPAGTFPEWEGKQEYQTGQRVLFEGIPFQAKWWNQGESPAANAVNIDDSPWLPLTQAQILKILEELKNQPTLAPSLAVTPKSTTSAKVIKP